MGLFKNADKRVPWLPYSAQHYKLLTVKAVQAWMRREHYISFHLGDTYHVKFYTIPVQTFAFVEYLVDELSLNEDGLLFLQYDVALVFVGFPDGVMMRCEWHPDKQEVRNVVSARLIMRDNIAFGPYMVRSIRRAYVLGQEYYFVYQAFHQLVTPEKSFDATSYLESLQGRFLRSIHGHLLEDYRGFF